MAGGTLLLMLFAGGAGTKSSHGRAVGAGRHFYNVQQMIEDAAHRRSTRARFDRLAEEHGRETAAEILYHRLRYDAEKSFQKAMNNRSAFTVLFAEM